VQGIEAITRGEVGVRSLQEHARALRGGEAAAGGAVAGAAAGGQVAGGPAGVGTAAGGEP